MRKFSRWIALVALAAGLYAAVMPTSSALTSAEMQSLTGGSMCSAAQGAEVIFAIAGFANPIFAGVAAGILIGQVIWC